MLNLFFTISLDAFQKSLQRLLVLLSEFFHLTHQGHLQIFIHYISLVRLLLLYHRAHRIRFVVILHAEENLFLLAHLNQTFAITLFQQELFGYLLFMKNKLLFLFDLKLLDQFKSRSFIVSHILVPSLRKFLKLQFLGTLNIDQFLFLGKAHILLLSLLFGSRKLFKTELHHLGPCVISPYFSIDSQLVHYSKRSMSELVRNWELEIVYHHLFLDLP